VQAAPKKVGVVRTVQPGGCVYYGHLMVYSPVFQNYEGDEVLHVSTGEYHMFFLPGDCPVGFGKSPAVIACPESGRLIGSQGESVTLH
jgi:hypothetical protein